MRDFAQRFFASRFNWFFLGVMAAAIAGEVLK